VREGQHVGSVTPRLGSNAPVRFPALEKLIFPIVAEDRVTGRRERRKNSPCVGRRKARPHIFCFLIARARRDVAHFVAHHFEMTINVLKL
jgi:hypothetical protein